MNFVEILIDGGEVLQRGLIMEVLVDQSEMSLCVRIDVDGILHFHVPLDGKGIRRRFFDERLVRLYHHLGNI